MARLTYPGGGAYLTFDGITWKSAKDWKVEDKPKFAERSSNTVGELPPIQSDMMSELSFTPMAFGSSIGAQFAALYPFTDPAAQKDTMVFPGSDLPAVIHIRGGKSVTYPAGQFTKSPPLTFAPEKALFGDALITLLLAQSSVAGDAASHETVASTAYTEPAMDETDELRDVYTLSLGAGEDAVVIETDQDGIVVTPTLEPEWIKPAGKTTQQARVKKITCTVEFTPLLMDVDTFYSTYFPMQGANVGLGKSASLMGLPLVIAGSAAGKALFSAPLVMPVDTRGPKFDDKSRIGKVKLKCGLVYDAGWQPLFTLGTVPDA